MLDWEMAAVADPVIDIAWLFARQGWSRKKREAFFETYDMPVAPPHLVDFLGQLCLLDQAVWAHSCLDDIEVGRHAEALGAAQIPFLRASAEFLETI
ncbi:MAG TPA: hypothetical protein VFQ79_08340 [Bryobacteraceae bacterium]|nr:hypothetical protein [Bryobacteraceae bacterium]